MQVPFLEEMKLCIFQSAVFTSGTLACTRRGLAGYTYLRIVPEVLEKVMICHSTGRNYRKQGSGALGLELL